MFMKMTKKGQKILKRSGLIIVFVIAVFCTTKIILEFGTITSAPTAAFIFIILVLLSAFFGDFIVAILTSLAAAFCFDYYFLLPVGTLNIASFSDWISLTAFLLTSTIISYLTSSAFENKTKANLLENSMKQLKEFGIWLLSKSHKQLTLSGIAEEMLHIFSFEYCSIHVYGTGKWQNFTGMATISGISQEVENKLNTFHDHKTGFVELLNESSWGIRYIQINEGVKPQALLVVKNSILPIETLETIAYMIGLWLMEYKEN
jgi:two-component system, OmpR family, sensor histidine kinase KdpD